MTRREIIVNKIHNERERQDELYGEQSHSPVKWLCILGEEFGSACKANNDRDFDGYKTELIHVAAVVVAALECYEREGG